MCHLAVSISNSPGLSYLMPNLIAAVPCPVTGPWGLPCSATCWHHVLCSPVKRRKKMRFLTRSFFRQSISPELFLQSFPRRGFSTVPLISFQERGWSSFPDIANRQNVIRGFILKSVNHFSNCSCGGKKKTGKGCLSWTEFQSGRSSCSKEPWEAPHAL